MKVPSLPYRQAINAFQKGGFVVVRQRGSHIRLQKRIGEKVIKITVPAHIPIKRSTLSRIIKSSSLTLKEFLKLV